MRSSLLVACVLALLGAGACGSRTSTPVGEGSGSAVAPPVAAAGEDAAPAAATPVRWLGSEVRFASLDEATAVLGADDAFTSAMSDFDRGVRMKTLDPVSESDYVAFAAKQARAWTDAEIAAWRPAAEQLGAALAGLEISLPEVVLLVKTTGAQEFEAAHTRANAIVLPESNLDAGGDMPFYLLAHELFHVASRYDRSLRDLLYPVLGFTTFAGIEPPPALDARRITNPDGHSFTHAIEVDVGGRRAQVVPFLQSEQPLADAMEVSDPTALVGVYLLEVDIASGLLIKDKKGAITPLPMMKTDYARKVSRNSGYLIHPEELIADNFAHLCVRRSGRRSEVPEPALLDELEQRLTAE